MSSRTCKYKPQHGTRLTSNGDLTQLPIKNLTVSYHPHIYKIRDDSTNHLRPVNYPASVIGLISVLFPLQNELHYLCRKTSWYFCTSFLDSFIYFSNVQNMSVLFKLLVSTVLTVTTLKQKETLLSYYCLLDQSHGVCIPTSCVHSDITTLTTKSDLITQL